jgi:hypothetical protein
MSGNRFTLADGENPFRIAPNKKGPNFPSYIECRAHYSVGPDNAFQGCGKNIEGEGSCWLCDVAIPGLEKTGDPAKLDMAERIGPKEQFIIQVFPIDRETGKFQKPKPFSVSTGRGTPGYSNPTRPTLAVQVQSKLVMGKKSYDDPNKGYNLNITRHGTGLGKGTRYDPPEGDESPSAVPKDLLAKLAPLEDFIPRYDAEDQKACFYGKPRPERGQAAAPATEADVDEPLDPDTQAEVDAGGFNPDFEPETVEAELEPEPQEEPLPPEDEFVDPDTPDGETYEPEFESELEPEPEPAPPPPPRRAAPAPVRTVQPARAATPAPARRTAPGPAPKGKAPAPPAKRR